MECRCSGKGSAHGVSNGVQLEQERECMHRTRKGIHMKQGSAYGVRKGVFVE